MARMAAGSGTNELDEADVMRFDVLPDDVLLEIFDCYVAHDNASSNDKKVVEAWQALVHVCRRWRRLVFQSPRRLNLRLFCTPKTRTRDSDTLDVWPALPLVVDSGGKMHRSPGIDNIIAALEQSNRVCQVTLYQLTYWQLELVTATMQVPFPELTCLKFTTRRGEVGPVILDSFLGGYAPHLLHFHLDRIPFVGMPNLHLSATNLVELRLTNIPPSGYISPEAMVASLSALSSLERLHLIPSHAFSTLPEWETRRPPPPRRTILPALEHFTYDGILEYLNDLVSRIDAPKLDRLCLYFDNDINLDSPRLAQFIHRTPKYMNNTGTKACLRFEHHIVHVHFGILRINLRCGGLHERLASVIRVCSSPVPSAVMDLYIEYGTPFQFWNFNSIESTLWLQFLLPFTAVRNLHLSNEFAPSIAAALQELIGDRVTEVLPSLRNVFVKNYKYFEKTFEQFVVARRLSGHPITISNWDIDWYMHSM